ncbi:uncharacterized protein LOC134191257 [Corticium candelabrum]|uniref:uncharacterized protein LOC134191257 n=1 Tax=Corticium candelabrum TaxID=121492 RepID=UPI002E259967|nr:uncharacterized protein LOC134191257 [Corticium candelabrum]
MELRASDEPEGTWHTLKMATIEAAKKAIGYKKNKRTDWFDSNNDEIQDLLRKKHDVFAKVQQNPRFLTLNKIFQELKRITRHKLRHLRDQWWGDRANHLRRLADRNDRWFDGDLKKVIGPSVMCSASLCGEDGQLLTDKSEILALEASLLPPTQQEYHG